MKKFTKIFSVFALCAVMVIMSVVPAFASTTYVEDHSKIDCASYYINGAYYRYLIKVPIGTPLSAISVKDIYTGEVKTLEECAAWFGYTQVEYQYTDATSDCYLLSFYVYPGAPKYFWYEHGIKLYYDYNGGHYMATNTANGSTTEGPGYILKNY